MLWPKWMQSCDASHPPSGCICFVNLCNMRTSAPDLRATAYFSRGYSLTTQPAKSLARYRLLRSQIRCEPAALMQNKPSPGRRSILILGNAPNPATKIRILFQHSQLIQNKALTGTPATANRTPFGAPSSPVAPVQRPVLDRLRDVLHRDVLCRLQVRDRPRHLQYPVMRPRAQPLLLHRPL